MLGHGHAGARTSQQHGGRACLQGSELRAQRRLLQRGPEAGEVGSTLSLPSAALCPPTGLPVDRTYWETGKQGSSGGSCL